VSASRPSGGIWAKSHRLPHYVTDEDVADAARRIAEAGPPVDVLLTHGCPVGLDDLTPKGRHGGQRCFLDAWRTIGPRIHLCGHLHVAQERSFKDGRQVINVGGRPRTARSPCSSPRATSCRTSRAVPDGGRRTGGSRVTRLDGLAEAFW